MKRGSGGSSRRQQRSTCRLRQQVAALALVLASVPPGIAGAQASGAPGYHAQQLDCGRFRQEIRSTITLQGGGARTRETTGRDGILTLRAAPSDSGLALVAWFDTLAVGRAGSGEHSPMAKAATEVTLKHERLLDEEGRHFMRDMRSNHRMPLPITFTETVEDSKAINRVSGGAIIIAASGMCDAGRIKHHLRNNLPRDENSILFVGFQAQGTLGRKLVDGASEVRLFGEDVPVRAKRYTIGGLSAHADQAGLMGWLGRFAKPPRQCFVVHGEAETAQLFADKVRADLGWEAIMPVAGKRYQLA